MAKQTMYAPGMLKYKSPEIFHISVQINMVNSASRASLFLQIFALPCRIFGAFCHPGGTGRPEEGCSASAPSFPSIPGGWERQGRLRGAGRTHLEGPLDASTASARQSPLRSRAQSAAGPVPRSPTLSGAAAAAAAAAAAGRGDQQPEGRLEILVRESVSLLTLHCFKIDAVSVAWA